MKHWLLTLLVVLSVTFALRAEDGVEMLPEDAPPVTGDNAEAMELPSDWEQAPEATPAPTPAPTPEPTPEATPEPTPQPTPEPRRYRPGRTAEPEPVPTPYVWSSKKWSKHEHYWLSYFEFGAMAAVPRRGPGYVIGPWIAWRPTLPLHRRFQLRGSLFLSVLKNNDAAAQRFTATSFEGFAAIGVDRGWLELGGGLQNWGSANGGSKPIASVNIGAPLKRDYLGFLDRVVLGGSVFFADPWIYHVRLGLGIAF